MYVTKEQYQQACAVDLAAWLLEHHPDLVTYKYGSVLLLADDHVSVKDGYNGFMNFRTGETGNNIDYLMSFLGYTYPAAVIALLGFDGEEIDTSGYGEYDQGSISLDASKNRSFTLPVPAQTSRNVYAYLAGRGIPADVVEELIFWDRLYQSEQGNNCVFVTPEQDYCEIRGTNTYADRRCKYRNECEHYECGEHQWCQQAETCDQYKPDPFHGCRKASPDRLWYLPCGSRPYRTFYICESAIDAISLYILQREQSASDSSVYISIGGVANQRTINRIKDHSYDAEVVIATDNDPAGDECRNRNQELRTIRPVNKDWNEDLQKGIHYHEPTRNQGLHN